MLNNLTGLVTSKPGRQSEWNRFSADSKELPSRPCLRLSHRQKNQLKSRRRRFSQGSLLSICCLAAPVLTEPQRSFHGTPGPGIRPPVGGKRDLEVWKDPQSRSLWCEPKDNHKTSTWPSEETWKGVKFGPWHGYQGSLTAPRPVPASEVCWSSKHNPAAPPLISQILKSSCVGGDQTERNDVRTKVWQRDVWSSDQPGNLFKYHGGVETIKVRRYNSIMLSLLRAASSVATFAQMLIWICPFLLTGPGAELQSSYP